MKQQKKLWVMAAILFIICGACVITWCGSEDDSPAVSPTDDSSQFVTLTDVVPDAILYVFYLSQKDLSLAVQHPEIPLE